MTALLNEDYEGGSNGVAMTTGNTGASSFSGTGTSVFDTSWSITGSGSGKFTTADAVSTRAFEVTFTSTGTVYVRGYYKKPAAPPAANMPLALLKTSAGGSLVGQLTANSDGTLKLQNSAGTIVGTKTAVLPSDCRWVLLINGATLTLKVFYGANINGTTPDETKTTSSNGQTAAAYFAHGIVAAGAAFTAQFDAVVVDTTTEPGPAIVAVNATVNGLAGTFSLASARGSTGQSVLVLPATDVTTTSWTKVGGTGTYASCEADATTNDDSSYTVSPLNSDGSLPKEEKLASFTIPGDKNGWLFVIRHRVDSASSSSVVVTVLQGSTTVVSKTFTNLPTGFTDFIIPLSPAQAALVTDGTDVRYRVAPVVTP